MGLQWAHIDLYRRFAIKAFEEEARRPTSRWPDETMTKTTNDNDEDKTYGKIYKNLSNLVCYFEVETGIY
jgi:hypothetical protein